MPSHLPGVARALIALALTAVMSLALAANAVAQGTGPDYPKTQERNTYITKTPEFQALLIEQAIVDQADLAAIAAAELGAAPGDQRNFLGNICHQRKQECAGDVRLYEWEENGFGNATDVLFGGRSGATISGRVWATDAGPAKRPGIVITTGSVQAPEVLYYSFAQVLAKAGYVVLTYDVQGQGRSDTFGEGVDLLEGVPSQAGQPFYDGTEDALDFLLSTQADPYVPQDSCGNANGGTRTSHAAKHQRRVDAGLNAAFNPFWDLVDPERIGIAGHSLGAGAVSYIGQIDDRVDAIVAWDNLRAPNSHPDCGPDNATRPDDPPITKPAIGMSNDYGLLGDNSYDADDPQSANGGFITYKDLGVDSMQVNRRGGTHYEYAFIPGETVPPLGLATLRGNDMAVWYTVAWFDKYVRCQGDTECEADADKRLLTNRWRDDLREGQVDGDGDSNMYSRWTRSRIDITDAGGSERICDDLRGGCNQLGPDGYPAGYDFLQAANTVDEVGGGGGGGGGGSNPTPCAIGQLGSDADDSPQTLPPSDAGDSIRGGRGKDRIRGGRGDDCLYGNGGKDVLKGDEGDDELRGNQAGDRLNGGADDDLARGNGGRDKVKGGDGDDTLNGGARNDTLVGGPGTDRLSGGAGNDTIKARDGEVDVVICNKGKRDKVIADEIDKVGKACDKVVIR